MNRRQRRLCRYRQGRPLPEIRVPVLLGAGQVRAAGSGVEVDLHHHGVEAVLSLPRRPRALAIAIGNGHEDLEAADLAVVRFGRGSVPIDALRRLLAIPELRRLPLVVAGSDAGASFALELTSALGSAVSALILDRELAAPVMMTPTLVDPDPQPDELIAFIESAGGLNPHPVLCHEQRRRLSRAMERRMRRDRRRRGPLTGRARSGLASLATAVVFILSGGPGSDRAEASWTTISYSNTTGRLTFTSDGGADQLTLTCLGGVGGELRYDTGTGAQTIPNPFFPFGNLPCASVVDASVFGDNGNDTIDFSGVNGTEYTQLGTGDVTIEGEVNNDVILGPQGIASSSLAGGSGDDTITGGSSGDLIQGGTQNDSLVGGGLSDTLDVSDATGALDVDLGAGTSTGRGTDTVNGIENAIGGAGDDSIVAGSATTSLVGNDGADTLNGALVGLSTLAGDDGADRLVSGGFTDSLAGGIGADTLLAGGSTDTLSGDGDGDSLVGEAGTDSMAGGDGIDTLEGGDTGNDTVNGGNDDDYASYSFAAGAVNINLATGSATGAGTDTLSFIEGAIGSDNADTITGDNNANTLYGNAGSDSFSGSGGADQIFGEDDNDTINGGAGANTLSGGGDQDSILSTTPTAVESLAGDNGNDTLIAAFGGSTLTGDAGTDSVIGAASGTGDSLLGGTQGDTLSGDSNTTFGGPDTLAGQGDADSLTGGLGTDLVDGGPGDDVLDPDGVNLSEGSVDTLIGNAGTDTLSQFEGTSGVDFTLTSSALSDGTTSDSLDGLENASLATGVGDNLLDASGFSGPVTLDASSQDDTLIGGPAADSLVGGAGAETDELRYSGNVSQTLTGAQHSALGINDTLSSFERASLTGGGSANLLNAQAFSGSVTLDGGGSNDTLLGGIGFGAEDSLIGGAGAGDRVDYTEDQPQVLTDTQHSAGLGGGLEEDTLSGVETASLVGGGSDNDLDASAFSGSTTLDGTAGEDTLQGSGGGDSLIGGADNDRILQTANSNQTLTNAGVTGDGTDTLSGVERASLTGGASANTIDASAFSAGQTTLSGQGADDTLLGGDANDSLLGDGGGDRIVQGADADQDLSNGFVTGDGSDTLGSIEQASLSGGGSANLIDATDFTSGPVTAAGLAADDTLYGGGGNDRLDGGADDDRVELIADADMTLSDTLLSTSSGAGNDTLVSIESASLRGGNAANDLSANAFSGDVSINGQSGYDTIEGGDGDDSLNGSSNDENVLRQRGDVNHVFTGPTFLTGRGTDTVNNFDAVSIEGGSSGNTIDVSAATTIFGESTLLGLDGADTIRGGQFTDSIDGGAGTDSLPAGNGFSDTLAGGTESDTLVGDSQDQLQGEGGDDRLDVTPGATSVEGGDGSADRLVNAGDFSMTLSGSQLSEAVGGNTPLAGIEQASLTGGTGANSLDASAFPGQVTLDGDDGFDTIIGAAGSDSLLGGPSADRFVQSVDADQTLANTVATGAGTDTHGGFENFSLSGGASGTSIDASAFTAAPVTIAGGGAADTLSGGGDADSLDGGPGTDRLQAALDADQTLTDGQHSVSGGGADTLASVETASLSGGAAANSIDASGFTLGSVSLAGLGSGDDLSGGTQGDELTGAAGGDTIDGNGSSDSIDGGIGSDSLDGGNGSDTLTATGDGDATLNDTVLSAGGDSDTLVSGSFEAAHLTGGGSANSLDASGFSAGPVSLDGLGGTDSLIGSSQGDALLGGTEADSLQGGPGSDDIDGGAGDDVADFSDDPGGTGIDADLGTGQVLNASTDNLTSVLSVIGTSFGDTITGDASANGIVGGGGADSLSGGAGADVITGDDGGDTLTGGAEADILLGGAGADTQNSQDGGTADTNDCGTETDTANADVQDTTTNCETVENPPEGEPGGPPDTTKPALKVSGQKKQKDKNKVIVKAKCTDEPCDFEATGTIKVKILKKNGKVKKTKKYDLKKATATGVDTGVKKELKLKFKPKTKTKIKKVIKKKKSKATIKVTATDANGNATPKQKFKVTVKK